MREHARERRTDLRLGERSLRLVVSLENPEIDSILSAGRTAMVLCVLITFVALLLLGGRFAHTISRPIHRLTRVADAVAAGDWNQRAALSFNDEIGRLGKAFDHAAQTITSLLSQRDQEASQRQAILESIADGVLSVDAHERLVLVNPTAQRLLGWPRVPLGQPISTVLPPVGIAEDDGRAVLGTLLCDLLHGRTASAERRVLIDGHDLRLSCAVVRDSEGQTLGAVAVLQDITEVVAADRAKTQFIATASHELRTPLAGIKGWVDLLHIQGIDNLSDDQRYALGIIRRQTDLLTTLVNDLLEVARLEQGQSEVERRLVDPAFVVKEVLSGFEAQIAAAGHRLAVDILEPTPPLLINISHLRRIVANMLSNALKYTPEGGRIAVRSFRQGSFLRIEVEDNGVGISSKDQSRIFKRFFRSENALSVKAGGTGLGLSIAKSMAELHGGTMSFTSSEGKGSRFWVDLPVYSQGH